MELEMNGLETSIFPITENIVYVIRDNDLSKSTSTSHMRYDVFLINGDINNFKLSLYLASFNTYPKACDEIERRIAKADNLKHHKDIFNA